MKALVCTLVVGLAVAAGSAQAADKVESFAIDRVMGKADAPVTIIEYASTTCGHCAVLHTEVLPRIKKEWVDTGKARLIYRDFPTGPAALSVGASMIAHCAGPERYFGVLGLIMQQMNAWAGASNPLEGLKKTVRLAGMTGDQVDECLTRQDLATAIQARAQAAQSKYGIDSTPTMIIDGEKIVGAQPYEVYDEALKAASR